MKTLEISGTSSGFICIQILEDGYLKAASNVAPNFYPPWNLFRKVHIHIITLRSLLFLGETSPAKGGLR